MGISRIKIAVQAVTGGIGPTGTTGPTGNTGPYVIGSSGPIGYGIQSIQYDSTTDGITFNFQNGLSAFFIGIRGTTGFEPPFPIISHTGSGDKFLDNINPGFTFIFRGISFSSGISASIISNTIYIENNPGETGSLIPNRLLTVKYNTVQQKYYLDSSDTANYKDFQYSGISYSVLDYIQRTPRDLLDSNNFNYSTGSTQGISHTGLTLGIDAAFYGITGTENDLKTSTWTPYIRYRTDYFDVDGGSGITIGTIKFGQLGPFNKTILLGTTLGSCCFCDSDGDRLCYDYVNKDYCDLMLGRFSSLSCAQRLDTNDCYEKRACCANGKCVNTSRQQCDKMNGFYNSTKICGVSFDCVSGSPATLLIEGACCCTFGNVIYVADPNLCGGPLYPPGQGQDCNLIQCCGSTGACCLPDNICETRTAEQCAMENGIFRGRGTNCKTTIC